MSYLDRVGVKDTSGTQIDPATSDKQLPDNHNVTVSNQPTDFPDSTTHTKLDTIINNQWAMNPLQVALGNVSGVTPLSLTGIVDEGIDISDTAIWSGADDESVGDPDQNILVPPTTAQVHEVVSSSANDTSAGTGARTVLVRGLTSWSSAEVSEVVTMNGTTAVDTVNSYVFINDATVITSGSQNVNDGRISVTAKTDATLQGSIKALVSRTENAFYAFPSTQTAVFYRWNGWMNREAGGSDYIEFSAYVLTGADSADATWVLADSRSVTTTATSNSSWEIEPPVPVPGPAIILISGKSSKADSSGGASYGILLVDNS